MGRNSTNNSNSFGLLLLRISTGGLMLFHGIHKLMNGHTFIEKVLADKGMPAFLWIGVPIAEVLAPALLILGLFSRISALLIALVMIGSIYLAFGTSAFSLTNTGGLKAELNIYFIFVGLALFIIGPGKYTLNNTKKWWVQ